MRSLALSLVALVSIGCGGSATPTATPLVLDEKTREASLRAADAYLGALSSGLVDQAAKLHAPAMASALPSSKLAETWAALVVKHGPLTDSGKATLSVADGFVVVLYPATFAKGRQDVKIVVDRDGKISGLWFVAPTAPAVPSAHETAAPPTVVGVTETDLPTGVVARPIVVGADGWPLAGSVTLPEGPGPFPAVVLVHGSGPHDLDETVGPNKPFKDLAHGLAARGVAAVRYEKRTRAHSEKLAANMRFTVDDETIADAASAVRALKSVKEIASDRIFVVGHSLGGMLAPRIAEAAPEVKGLVVLAGNTRPLEEAIVAQLDYLSSLPGSTLPKEQVESMKKEAARVAALDEKTGASTTDIVFGTPPSYWIDLKKYAPATVAARLQKPMLFLQGGRDYQVTDVDLEGWKTALKGRRDVMFRTYPSLNHLFLEGEGKSTPAEYEKPGNIPTFVLDDIASFVKR